MVMKFVYKKGFHLITQVDFIQVIENVMMMFEIVLRAKKTKIQNLIDS